MALCELRRIVWIMVIRGGVAGGAIPPAEGVGAYLREQIAPQGALPPHKKKLLEMP